MVKRSEQNVTYKAIWGCARPMLLGNICGAGIIFSLAVLTTEFAMAQASAPQPFDQALLKVEDVGDSFELFIEGPLTPPSDNAETYQRFFVRRASNTASGLTDIDSFAVIQHGSAPSLSDLEPLVLRRFASDQETRPEGTLGAWASQIPANLWDLREAEGPALGDEARWLRGRLKLGGRDILLSAGAFRVGELLVGIVVLGLDHLDQSDARGYLELLAKRVQDLG